MKKILVASLGIVAFSIIPAKAANLGGSSDIFLGFDTQNGTGAFKSLVIDLGTIGNITTNGVINIDQTATNSLLSTTFGASWWTRTDLNWFAFGGLSTNTMVIAANTNNSPLDSGVDPGVISQADRNQISSTYGVVNAEQGTAGLTNIVVGSLTFKTSKDPASGSPVAFVTDSFANQIDGTQAAFNGNFPAQGVALFDGTDPGNLALWSYTPSGVNWIVGDTEIADIMNASGVIQITAVPEPQTYALLLLAGGTAYLVRRRLVKNA